MGLGYGYFKLHKERRAFEADMDYLERKTALLQKKYAEKKAAETHLLRTKLYLEGQKRALQSEVNKMEEEKESLLEEQKKLKKRITGLEDKASSSGDRAKALSAVIAKLKKEQEEIKKKHRKAIAEREERIAEVKAEKEKMESELRNTLDTVHRELDRCESHNARLYVIAEELVERYKNKGVMTSILQEEPFTQIEKVEMENLLQEYRDEIERQKLAKEKGTD
jgi:chromosome segregation ATPase